MTTEAGGEKELDVRIRVITELFVPRSSEAPP